MLLGGGTADDDFAAWALAASDGLDQPFDVLAGACFQAGVHLAVELDLHLDAEALGTEPVEPRVKITVPVGNQADEPLAAGVAEVLDVGHVGRTEVRVAGVAVPLEPELCVAPALDGMVECEGVSRAVDVRRSGRNGLLGDEHVLRRSDEEHVRADPSDVAEPVDLGGHGRVDVRGDHVERALR
ncbi:MAG: hypothetical protein JWP06_166 [Candidatus Saccharibacteria bacterium]|nr:hypothetical protein [Candidatus Saccharibacteria bacterium]